jgi:Arc/MetJ-type ribon-helix-helix transcriptional regulator
VTLCAAGETAAQSLADIARKEAERRQQAKNGRLYTNTDLVPVDPAQAPDAPPPAEAPTGPGEQALPAPEGADAAAAPPPDPDGLVAKMREKRGEDYWRNRAQVLRTALAKTEANAAQSEIRLKELDASEQTPAVLREREITAKAAAQFQSEARARRDEIARFEAFAKSQKVPPEWIR